MLPSRLATTTSATKYKNPYREASSQMQRTATPMALPSWGQPSWTCKIHPVSAFGPQPDSLRPGPPNPRLDLTGRNDKQFRAPVPLCVSGLYGFATRREDVFGRPKATMFAHKPWSPERYSRWTERPGYGVMPRYPWQREQGEEGDETAATTNEQPLEETPAKSLLRSPSFASVTSSVGTKMELQMSVATIRLTEHPLLWKKKRASLSRSSSASALRGQSSALLRSPSSPTCCTYGVSPAFAKSRSPGTPGIGRPPSVASPVDSSPPRSAVPRWRGVARPYPQDF
jgi:hypothetical protein